MKKEKLSFQSFYRICEKVDFKGFQLIKPFLKFNFGGIVFLKEFVWNEDVELIKFWIDNFNNIDNERFFHNILMEAFKKENKYIVKKILSYATNYNSDDQVICILNKNISKMICIKLGENEKILTKGDFSIYYVEGKENYYKKFNL